MTIHAGNITPLNELALLPNLPYNKVRGLVLALAASLTFGNIAFSAISMLMMFYFHYLTAIWVVFLVGATCFGVCLGTTVWIVFACVTNYMFNNVITRLAVMAFQFLTLLAWFMTLDNFFDTGDYSDGWVLVLVMNVCLLIVAYMWSSRRIKALPHPYLLN